MKNADPKKLFEALKTDAPVEGFDEAQVALARAVSKDPSGAQADKAASLPEPLLLAVLEGTVRAKQTALAEALSRASNKAAAKAAKKALYQLKSQGVAVAEPPKPAAAEPTHDPEDGADAWPSILSPVTGSGERALLLAHPQKGGKLEIIQLILTDEAGVIHHGASELGRSHYKKQIRTLQNQKPQSSLLIPLAEAKAHLARAVAVNLKSKTAMPQGLDESLRHLGIEPDEREEELPQPTADDERLATEGTSLHDEPEIRGWLPNEPELRALGGKLDDVIASPLFIHEAQRAQGMHQAFAAAAHAFFTPPMKKLYARRLWAMAEYFERTGRARKAEVARAEAKRLFHDAPGLFSPFALRLYEKVMDLSRELGTGEVKEVFEKAAQHKPSPEGQTAQPASAPGPKMSPGGIILP